MLVLARIPYAIDKQRTDEAVAKIHATKLTLTDVMGDNLPPDPGAEADKTVEGIDANHNGIRDDVELAIFKEYPNSAKTRAVLLQYALALQMEMTQSIINAGTVVGVAQERTRAAVCIGEIVSRDNIQRFINLTQAYNDFVRNKQINTAMRNQAEVDFLEHIDSYSDIEGAICDINLDNLHN